LRDRQSIGKRMKKFVELQVLTKPCGSSIKGSSTPALMAWIQLITQFSLLWG
jgi:hypothetical protein